VLPSLVEDIALLGTANYNATGNELDNLIVGNAGDNILSGGSGNDALNGSGDNDTYVYGRNDGHDVITNGLSTNSAPTGSLQLVDDLAPGNLWFKQSGQDLVINVMGSNDDVTVTGWFANQSNALEEIVTANGWEIEPSLSTRPSDGHVFGREHRL
jgi:hypothetical protein